MMKFAVPVFPGSNCDHDMVNALRDILHVTEWCDCPLCAHHAGRYCIC